MCLTFPDAGFRDCCTVGLIESVAVEKQWCRLFYVSGCGNGGDCIFTHGLPSVKGKWRGALRANAKTGDSGMVSDEHKRDNKHLWESRSGAFQHHGQQSQCTYRNTCAVEVAVHLQHHGQDPFLKHYSISTKQNVFFYMSRLSIWKYLCVLFNRGLLSTVEKKNQM